MSSNRVSWYGKTSMPFINLDAIEPKQEEPQVETVLSWEIGKLVGFLVASGGAIRVEIVSTEAERLTLTREESKRFALAILSQQKVPIP